MITNRQAGQPDSLTPRERLSHKLRDGAYRARQLGQVGVYAPLRDLLHLLDIDNCYYCGTDITDYYELDHKTPLDRGGFHLPDNLCKACGLCNETKGTMTEDEYRSYLAGGFSEIQQSLVERLDAA